MQEYPEITFTRSDEDILRNHEIRAVVIAAPACEHYRLSKKYLQAGKDVLVEKPLAANTEEGRLLVRLASEHRVPIQVGHIERFNPAVQAVRSVVREPRFIS